MPKTFLSYLDLGVFHVCPTLSHTHHTTVENKGGLRRLHGTIGPRESENNAPDVFFRSVRYLGPVWQQHLQQQQQQQQHLCWVCRLQPHVKTQRPFWRPGQLAARLPEGTKGPHSWSRHSFGHLFPNTPLPLANVASWNAYFQFKA